MPPGKPQRPLFELLRQNRPIVSPPPSAAPSPPPVHAPPPVQATPLTPMSLTASPIPSAPSPPAHAPLAPPEPRRAPVSPAPDPTAADALPEAAPAARVLREPRPSHFPEPDPDAESMPMPGRVEHRRVAVPMATLYAAGAFVVVLVIVTFSVGFTLGRSEAGAAAVDDDSGSALLARDPDPRPAGGGRTTPPAADDTETPATADPERYLDGGGSLANDPRVKGENYLELAVLSRRSAIAAMAALATDEIDSFAVREGRSEQYRLICLELGVPSESFSKTKSERAALERRVRAAGKAWKAAGGASDFSEPLWRRFDG